ncbi:MAG TPA: hypothetical protein VLE69_02655 [Candidatus Saccharimonadales bacterium]|nr:hypothetical protein [Candidatus Saccharimonadales bacterium]
MLNPALLINKRIRSVKVRSQRYINNEEEPRDKISHDTLAKDEMVLVEASPPMRQRFRLIAQRFRIITIEKKNRKNKQ